MAERGFSIGEASERSGVKATTIRFYEDKGLIEPMRTGGNQRRFLRSDIRRLSFILIVQKLGLSLEEIGEHLRALPAPHLPALRAAAGRAVPALGKGPLARRGEPREPREPPVVTVTTS